MSLALINQANRIRSRDPRNGDDVAAAFTITNDELDAIYKLIAGLTDPSLGFAKDQIGALAIDVLAIRNLTKRFTFEDAPDTQNIVTAGYRVPLVGEVIRLNNTSGGSLTLNSTPTIATGKNLQPLRLINIGAQNIVFQDRGTLAGSGLALGAATRTLKTRGILTVRYSSDLALWLEDVFSNNL